MCQRIGLPPISTIGFGLIDVSSASLEPKPPAKITTFISHLILNCKKYADTYDNKFTLKLSLILACATKESDILFNIIFLVKIAVSAA